MVGILAAIALPTFLNQKAKAQETEGKTLIGAMNRAQQAHHAVYQAFATSLADLELGLAKTANYYEYDVVSSGDGALVTNKARSRNSELRGYAGVVARPEPASTVVLVCRSLQKGTADVDDGMAIGPSVQCPSNYQPLE